MARLSLRSIAVLVALVAIAVTACGTGAPSPGVAAAPPPKPPSAFDLAFQSALAQIRQGGSLNRNTRSLLPSDPKELAAAITANIAQGVLSGGRIGGSALDLLSYLPPAQAIAVGEEAVSRDGVAPPRYPLPPAFLLQEIRGGPAWAVQAALQSAMQDQGAGSTFWLTALESVPRSDAKIAAEMYYLPGSPTFLQRILTDPRISAAVKRGVLATQYFVSPAAFPALDRALQAATDPALKEQILVDLAENGAPGAVTALAEFTDHSGTFAGVVWPATLMSAVKNADPRGYIAQGMDAVSALTGTAYVDIHRCIPHTTQCGFYLEGQPQYDPAKLAEWQTLLGRLGQHPGSDDIAYVIGRIDEIDHHYAQAVLAFNRALYLPDGGMQSAATSRLVWVLDVEMTSAQIAAFIPSAPSGLRPVLRYAEAVHLLREGHYAQAAAGLAAVEREGAAISAALPGISPPSAFLTLFIPWQLQAAKALARLARGKASPIGAFRLAQYNFQRPLLYYLGLWQGSRDSYIAFFSGGTTPTPAWLRYQTQFNNYAVAEELYAVAASIAAEDPALRATDLYGEAESLIELMNYGAGTDLYPPYELFSRAKGLLQAAAKAAPHAGVGGKAMMSLYYLTGNRTLLSAVIKDHPGTSAAYDAKIRLKPSGAYTAYLPGGALALDFQTVWTSNRLSAKERAAMRAMSGTTSRIIGRETLLQIAAKLPNGSEPMVVGVQETAPGKILVQWSSYTPADVPGLQPVYFAGRSYARVFAAFHSVRFQKVPQRLSFGMF